MDRLSELPESILLHILSFLTMKDVVKTAVLSKRWPHLWTIIQELDFSGDGFYPYQDFVDFVNRTLLSRGTCKIRRLRIHLFLNASSSKDYVGWMLYAAKNNVEELFLDFDSDCCDWLTPKCVSCNSSLKTLRLWSCRLIPDIQIRWNLLTKLTLRFSVLWDESIHKIMVGAPKLEFFELDSCWGYDDLAFDSPSLRVLIVREYESGVYEYGPVMTISTPNVQSLQLSGSLYRKCVLMNVPSVVRATLNFHPYTYCDREKKNLKWKQDNLMELVGNLKHVESLTLGSWCIEVLAQREKRRVPSIISTHKCITLSMPMKDDDLLGTVNLLKGSPDLEMLIVDMEPKFYEEALALKEKRRIPSEITAHKCVTLSVPMRDDDLLGTINVLKGSPALQTLIIDMQSELCDQLPKATEYLCNSNGADYLASQANHVGCLHHLKTVKLTKFVVQHSVFPFLEFILKNGRVLENLVIIAKRGLHENSPESLLKVAQRLLSMPRASSQAVVTLLN